MPKDKVDTYQLEHSWSMLQNVKDTLKDLRSDRKSVDMDTAEKIEQNTLAAIGKLHEMLAVVSSIKSQRRRQSTTLVGGGRSKG
jgi:hypothetical protein